MPSDPMPSPPAAPSSPNARRRAGSGFTLQGRPSFQFRSVALLTKVTLDVGLRRLLGRPLVPEWDWGLECSTLFLREQMRAAFAIADPADAREFLDCLVFNPVAPSHTQVRPELRGPRGSWFEPEDREDGRTLLYLHGGGYAFHVRSHAHMITLFAEAARARTFAPDYRLTPAHPHPAQLEDAIAAYRWLLAGGADPRRTVVGGDSAGGHLALMLLLALRAAGLPQPALAVGICPWVDVGERGASLFANDRYDWVQGAMALQYGEWYRGGTAFTPEELSPIHGDFRGLAPIYLQAGGKEVLVDMIREFADVVRAQGVDVALDVWEHMTHDFQAYGSYLPESAAALAKFGEVVTRYTGSPA